VVKLEVEVEESLELVASSLEAAAEAAALALKLERL